MTDKIKALTDNTEVLLKSLRGLGLVIKVKDTRHGQRKGSRTVTMTVTAGDDSTVPGSHVTKRFNYVDISMYQRARALNNAALFMHYVWTGSDGEPL